MMLYNTFLYFTRVENEGPDQIARMRSLIWSFAVRIRPRHILSWRGTIVSVIKMYRNSRKKALIAYVGNE